MLDFNRKLIPACSALRGLSRVYSEWRRKPCNVKYNHFALTSGQPPEAGSVYSAVKLLSVVL